MNRRDIVVIATLLNGAILSLLFMLANSAEDPTLIAPPDALSEIAHSEVSFTSAPATTATETYTAHPSETSVSDIDPHFHSFELSPEDLFLSDEKETLFTQKPEKRDLPSNTVVDITVKSGDVLERIARANGTTVEAIKALNNLHNEKLKIGQLLKVPVGTAPNSKEKAQTAELSKPSTTRSSSSEASYYTLRSGDNPWKIARRFHVKMDDLLRLNNLDEEKARNLKVGDRVRIR